MAETIRVEVAYALPNKQSIVALDVPAGCSVFEAAELSGIVELYPEIELGSAKMGIFGKAVADPRAQQLKPGDRVEIYRPLVIDPKEARRARARNSAARQGT